MTCTEMINLATGWFDIVEIPTYDLDEVMGGNGEYKGKSYVRVIQLFNNIWICRYPHPSKIVFDNIYEFKQDLTPLLKDFAIKMS